MAVLFALLSATCNGGSTILQRMAAAAAPPETAFRFTLLTYLLRRRIWLAGMGAMIASFLLQAAALDRGTLAVVQPLLITKLPITVVLAIVVFRGLVHVGAHDWLAVAAMSVGLALVLVVSAPTPTPTANPPTVMGWWLSVATTLIVTAVLVHLSLRHPGTPRASLLGAASGIAFGLTAAFIKAVTDVSGNGLVDLALSWPPYATAGAGLAAVLLQQNALQAGSLAASQPASMIVGTVVSVVLGTMLFHEQLHIGAAWPVAVIGAALVIYSVFAAAHSPLVSATVASSAPREHRNEDTR
ncbi:MAG TPA: DMT family transporter [Nocardioidaceae bacterium]|nr:DMT family transporter [Nocardioidaceae bacterium]